MTLLKFAETCDIESAETELLVQIRSINNQNILGECRYGVLEEYVRSHGPDMKDWIVVDMTRGDLIEKDLDRPIWDKSIIIRVV